jgi:hypothetical protein
MIFELKSSCFYDKNVDFCVALFVDFDFLVLFLVEHFKIFHQQREITSIFVETL